MRLFIHSSFIYSFIHSLTHSLTLTSTTLAVTLTHRKIKTEENKLVKPYERFQSQGHVLAILLLVACLVVEIIPHWIFAFADPVWPCIKVKVKVKVNETIRSVYAMYRSTVLPSLSAIA